MEETIIAGVLLVATIGSPVSAAALAGVAGDEPPLADAGLDQSVSRGSVVQLDATGSRDPDGSIIEYRWTIRTPDEGQTTPDCGDCPRTTFDAEQVGTYEVELTVTDDDGSAESDVLYVTVIPGVEPRIDVQGQPGATVGDRTTFTATLEGGAAPLSHVVWSVGGTEVTNHSVGGSDAVDDLRTAFPNEGTKSVTATVYDQDGQSDTDRTSIDVSADDSGAIADRDSPVILGPQEVTGGRPLVGSYRIASDVTSGQIRGVYWYRGFEQAGYGTSEDVRWEPGDHELHAIVEYVDGSQTGATFSDGTNDIIADPQPDLRVENISASTELSGTVVARDGYENLWSTTVVVNGTTIQEWPTDPVVFPHRGTDRKVVDFLTAQITHSEPQNVSITATDMRGQTVTTTRTVTPEANPEIVRSEFVNDPVDSYHERIDPERYAAHHVLEIKLNGADPEEVYTEHFDVDSERVSQLTDPRYEAHEEVDDGILTVHTYWNAPTPGDYQIDIYTKYNSDIIYSGSSGFEVTPSDPELRFEVATDGTDVAAKEWGILVDASSSFDPDGSKLDYNWYRGADPITEDNKTARFSSRDFALLIIEDKFGHRTRSQSNFHDYYNPGFDTVEEVTEGPYKPNDTVRFEVQTNDYKFGKKTYEVDIGLSGPDVDVVRWNRHEVDWDGDAIRNDRRKVYRGEIEITAADLVNRSDGSGLSLYNEMNPEQSRETTSLPSVEVMADLGTLRTNVTVSDHRYLVEKPRLTYVTAITEEDRDSYLEDGYEVERESHYGTEYTLEERVQVQEAKHRTDRRTFTRKFTRRMFLRDNPSWTAAGSYTETETWTTTETTWRSSRSGRGRYTGNTRRVLVEPAEYRTLRQYRYSRWGSGTYWSTNKYSSSHRYTGRWKRVKTSSAEYRTEYQFEYEETHSRTKRYYEATRTVQVQEERYEWQTKLTTKNDAYAKRLVDFDEDIRIESTTPAIEWEMVKQDGTVRREVDSYDDPDNVIETRATISGDIVQHYRHPSTGQETYEHVREFTEEFKSDKPETKDEIRSQMEERDTSNDGCDLDTIDGNNCEFRTRGGT